MALGCFDLLRSLDAAETDAGSGRRGDPSVYGGKVRLLRERSRPCWTDGSSDWRKKTRRKLDTGGPGKILRPDGYGSLVIPRDPQICGYPGHTEMERGK